MPRSLNENLELSLSLSAKLDPRSLAAVQAKLDSLVRDPKEILDVRQLQNIAEIASKVQRAFVNAGQPTAKALDVFSTKFNQMVQMYAVAQEDYNTALRASDEAGLRAAHERLEIIKKGMDSLSKTTSAVDVSINPSGQNIVEAGKNIGEAFADTLDKMKSGDIQGMAKAFFSGSAKYLAKQAASKAAASTSAGALGDTAAASQLATAAKGLGTAAVALAGVGAAITAFIGLLVMADQQEKEFNKSLLEGAGIADWSYGQMSDGVMGLTDDLRAASHAALDLAVKYRGDATAYTAILSAMNQSGYTYRELTKGATTAAEKQEQLRTTMDHVAQSANMMGISFGEAANTYAEFQEMYGMDQKQTYEQFLDIAIAAQNSSMGTKRFFTAVSQATSGMALYNVRMEEAASLLALTSKILGGTDASEFIKSLAQGMTSESYQDSVTGFIKAGAGDMGRIAKDGAKRLATSLIETLKNDSAGLSKAIQDVGLNLDISTLTDPDSLIKAMAKMTKDQKDELVFQLTKMGGENNRNMGEQLAQLHKLVRASGGGLTAGVQASTSRDLQANLATSLQRVMSIVGDNRMISDLNAPELLAVEQVSGFQRDYIEKLSRVQEYLKGMFLDDNQGFATFEQFVSGAKLDLGNMGDGLEEVQKTAEDYMSVVADNTGSIFKVLENQLKAMLSELSFISDGIATLVRKATGQSMDRTQPLSKSAQTVEASRNEKAIRETEAALAVMIKSASEYSHSPDMTPEGMDSWDREVEAMQDKLDSLLDAKAGLSQARAPEYTAELVKEDALRKLAEYAAGHQAAPQGSDSPLTAEELLRDIKSRPAFYRDMFPQGHPLWETAKKGGIYQDFIVRPGGSAQRFSSSDTVLGFKDNGPIDKMLGDGNGGGTINNFNLYGGDTATIYNTIRTAIKGSK